jgi:hypothetical protein
MSRAGRTLFGGTCRAAMAVIFACSCLGCASLPPPPTSADEAKAAATSAAERTRKAIDDTCTAALTVCALQELIPAERRDPEDEATCADAREFCANRP